MSEWPLEHAGDKKGVKKLLEGKFETNPEVLWRLARSYFDILDGLTKATKLDQKRLCEKAFDTIKLALEEGGENNFAVQGLTRRLAATLFAQPPSSSCDEALSFFLRWPTSFVSVPKRHSRKLRRTGI